jgi:Icc protein
VTLSLRDCELFGVTESSLTLSVTVCDASGPVDAPVRIRLNDELRAESAGTAGPRLVRIEGLRPATTYRIAIEADGAAPPEHGRYLPAEVATLAAPRARQVASFATLNDLHFGEPRFGGVLLPDGEYGPESPGYPAVSEKDEPVPYWLYMNQDAVADINALDVDATIVKGDIADRGLTPQFEIARKTLDRLEKPWHGFLGNHDHYGVLVGEAVDGYALLGQPRAPRTLDLGGWRLVFVDTVLPGHHHGILPPERRQWLADALAETRDAGVPTLVFMHHHPVPPENRDTYPNTIGLRPEDSVPLYELIGEHSQVRAVLIGHTHRNRVRTNPASGAVPYAEVNCVKDYPGGFAHYRLFEDGHFRQEVRRTSSERALAHSTRCGGFFAGRYRDFALGALSDRSFASRP